MPRPHKGYLHKRGRVYWIDLLWKGRRIQQSLRTTILSEAMKTRDDIVKPLQLRDHAAILEAFKSAISSNVSQADTLSRTRTPMPEVWKKFPLTHTSLKSQTGYRPLAPLTVRTSQVYLDRFVSWARNTPYMEDVTEKMALDYQKHLLKTTVPGTVNKMIVTLRRIWEQADLTAFSKVSHLREKTEGHEAFTLEELRSLVAAADDQELRLLIVVGAYTGLRLKDCVTLQWSQVKDGRLVRTAAKTGKSVSLPLADGLEEAMSAFPHTSDFVMPRLNELYVSGGPARIGDKIRALLVKVGMNTSEKISGRRSASRKSFHSLRHTFATLMASAGVPLIDVQDWLGHSSVAMTSVYTHVTSDSQKRILNALSTATCT